MLIKTTEMKTSAAPTMTMYLLRRIALMMMMVMMCLEEMLHSSLLLESRNEVNILAETFSVAEIPPFWKTP